MFLFFKKMWLWNRFRVTNSPHCHSELVSESQKILRNTPREDLSHNNSLFEEGLREMLIFYFLKRCDSEINSEWQKLLLNVILSSFQNRIRYYVIFFLHLSIYIRDNSLFEEGLREMLLFYSLKIYQKHFTIQIKNINLQLKVLLKLKYNEKSKRWFTAPSFDDGAFLSVYFP